MSELARLPARSVFGYAVMCLEHQAAELATAMDMELVPVEAFAGRCALRKQLQRDIRRMLGGSPHSTLSSDEHAAIAEVEREIARDFPFYFDKARLHMMHEALGMLRLEGP